MRQHLHLWLHPRAPGVKAKYLPFLRFDSQTFFCPFSLYIFLLFKKIIFFLANEIAKVLREVHHPSTVSTLLRTNAATILSRDINIVKALFYYYDIFINNFLK